MSIAIRPHLYRAFTKEEPCHFRMITNPNWVDKFKISPNDFYLSSEILTYEGGELIELLHSIEEPAHVMIISPDHFVYSIKEKEVGKRIICCMATNSTPATAEDIQYFLKSVEKTDPNEQQKLADRIFELGEPSDFLVWRDEQYEVEAVFRHQDESFHWHEQTGPLAWGQQQLMPAGEVSVCPEFIMEYANNRYLDIKGEIALKGYPILHSGFASFMKEDQARIHGRLAPIKDHALIATVKDGIVVELKATHPSVEVAKQMLEAMFAVDSRYAVLWEVGHGINTDFEVLSRNVAMNEVYGAKNGAIHFGFGLTPWTQYHLDIICPNTKVLNDKGELLIGPVEARAASAP